MRHTALALAAAVALLAPSLFTPLALAHDDDPVEAALAMPPATGLLVMAVVPGTQAEAAGIVAGDVVLSYDGEAVTTLEALAAAKEAYLAKAEAERGRLVCVVLRASDGEKVEIPLAPGQLGMQLAPVEEGKPPHPLPADTGAVLDAALAGDRDEWFVLSMGGAKCGVEHIQVKAQGDLLTFTHEVAFDGGEQWGLHHGIVNAALRCGATADPVSLSYENGLNGWISRAQVVRDGNGRPVWRAAGGMADEDPVVTEKPLRGDQSSVPTYAVAQIARLLPQEKGACFRFRPVADWDGEPGIAAAIVCTGEETLTIDGKEHATWKYEQQQLGRGVIAQYWFDAQRRIVQADYGGPVATISTKPAACEGLHAELKLRTAD